MIGAAAMGVVSIRAQEALPQVGVSEGAARAEVLRSLDSGDVNDSPAARSRRCSSF